MLKSNAEKVFDDFLPRPPWRQAGHADLDITITNGVIDHPSEWAGVITDADRKVRPKIIHMTNLVGNPLGHAATLIRHDTDHGATGQVML